MQAARRLSLAGESLVARIGTAPLDRGVPSTLALLA